MCGLPAILLPHAEPLPAVALGSRWILYALRALALFYGFLLLFVPLVRVTGALATLEADVASLERRTTELSDLVDRATANLAADPAGPTPPSEGGP